MKKSILLLFAGLNCLSSAFGQISPVNRIPIHVGLPKEVGSASPVGHLDGSQTIHVTVGLTTPNMAALEQFADDVSNPASPNYRHFITPDEVGARFGLPIDAVTKVKNFLAAQGLKINLVAKNRMAILAEGTTSQIESTFGTSLQEYVSADGYVPPTGKLYAFTSQPSLPSDVSSYVQSISGLESFTHPKPQYIVPSQLRVLYDTAPIYNAGLTGAGRTVAISSWDGFRLSNVPYEYAEFSLPNPPGGVLSNVTVVTINGGSGSGTQHYEGDLDIQATLDMAPLCNLRIYDGDPEDLIGVLTQESDDNIADVITESYGWSLDPVTTMTAHNLHVSMTAEGITYMAASGDSGTSLSTYPYPDIEPNVLIVGGTTPTVSSSGQRSSELGWADSGGGWVVTTDSFNVLPSWQKGTGIPTNINYRLTPDVALDANPTTGYVVYYNTGFYEIGGTSGASPTFAGSLGLVEQQLIAKGALSPNSSGQYRLGRINDLLYSYNGKSSVFYDITSGSNGHLPNGKISDCTVGWDFVTGWGAIDFNGFANQIIASAPTLAITPSSAEGGYTAVTGTITLPSAAPASGTTFTISGGNSLIGYPSSVTVASGNKTATFSITTSAVSSNQSESLTATNGTNSSTSSFTLTPTSVASLSFNPNSVIGGNSVTGTVTLARPAASPSGDIVGLTGGDSFVSFPATVTVAAGATTATFTVNSSTVTSTDIESISATLGTSKVTTPLTVTANPVVVTGLSFTPASVAGGLTSTGTVTLSTAAGTGGATVTISGGDSSVTYPSSVSVSPGAATATFTVTTKAVSTVDTESLTATLGTGTASATLTVNPATVSSVSFSPATVTGGSTSTGTVTLSSAAGPSGIVVSLSGGDGSVSYPASVTVAPGTTSANFSILTAAVSAADSETITAKTGTVSTMATLTINPAALTAFSIAPTSVAGGVSATGTVTLSAAAGPSGNVVSLSGGDSKVSYPATVTVPAGATTASFTISSSSVTTNDTETLTAASGGGSQNATLTLTNALALSGISFSATSITGTGYSIVTVTLNKQAPSGGAVISISGGDSSISYPATLTIGWGSSTGHFTIGSVAVSTIHTETISVSYGGTTLTGTLTVSPAPITSFTLSSSSVVGGTSVTATIKLSKAAGPGGNVITLSGGDGSISYPSTVTVPAGSGIVSFTITTKAVTTTTTETITATGPDGTSQSVTLTLTP